MPLDAPTASSVIAEARERGYTLQRSEDGVFIFLSEEALPPDDIDFWWRWRAVSGDEIRAALIAEAQQAA